MADSSLTKPVPATSPPPVPVRWVASDRGPQSGPPPLPVEGPPSPPAQGLLRWFTSSAALAFTVSLLCHVLLILVLAIWVFDVRIPLVPMLIDGANKTGIPTELQDLPEISLTEQGGKLRNVATVPASKLLAQPTDRGKLPTDLTDSVDLSPNKTAGGGNTKGSGDEDAGKASAPHGDVKASKNAVSKGSFRVWSIPEKPVPQKPYYICIEVAVPKKFGKRYLVKDLTGTIHGNESRYDKNSEDYVQNVPWDGRLARLGGPEYRHHTFRRDFKRKRWLWVNPKNRFNSLPVVDGKALLMIKIPGADTERIKDTIIVRSKLLKEQQTLEIVF
jgi:hypothetical protein